MIKTDNINDLKLKNKQLTKAFKYVIEVCLNLIKEKEGVKKQ